MKKRKLMKEKQRKIKLLNVEKKEYEISQYSNIIIVFGNKKCLFYLNN